jgi:hypothetical protein
MYMWIRTRYALPPVGAYTYLFVRLYGSAGTVCAAVPTQRRA